MKSQNFIVFLLFFIIIIIILTLNKSNLIYIKSDIDGIEYMVDQEGGFSSANVLAKIKSNLDLFKNNIDDYITEEDKKDKVIMESIKQFKERYNKNTVICETPIKSNSTSYTINKGEKMSFCIRSKKTKQIHDLNLLMYVALHEASHIGCKEEGHTELFWKIFKNFAEKGIKMGIYKKIEFYEDPHEYCGMEITSSVV